MKIKLLVYGPSGHGKTTLLGTAIDDPRLRPMAFLNFEGGTISIASKTRDIAVDDLGHPEEGLIDVVDVQSWGDFDRVYEKLRGLTNVYRSIGVDSLTEVNYLNLRDAVSLATQADPKHDADIPEMRDYQRSAVRLRALVRQFRDLDAHVFFSALSQDSENSQTGLSERRPALTGKLSEEIVGLLDVVGYLAIVEDDEASWRRLLCQPASRCMAKDRSEGGRLGTFIENPTLSTICDHLSIQHPLPEDPTKLEAPKEGSAC